MNAVLFATPRCGFLHAAFFAAAALALLTRASSGFAACDPGICGASPCIVSGTHTIDSGCVLDFGSKDVLLTGSLVGDGNEDCYTIRADDFTVRGIVRAQSSCIEVDLTGTFRTEIVSNSPARIDVRNANDPGDGVVISAARIELYGRDINAKGASGFDGGFIALTATTGDVVGGGGNLSLEADGAGGGYGGAIDVSSLLGAVNLPTRLTANGSGAEGGGGEILVSAVTAVTIGAAPKNLEANGSNGGFGGSIEIWVENGPATIDGNLNVNGNGPFGDAGSIFVEANDVETGSTWNARGSQAGFGGSILVNAVEPNAAGDITMTSSATFQTFGGLGGGPGGDITLLATGSLEIDGDMDASGQGADSFGGTISLQGGNASTSLLSTGSTSRIVADSTGTGSRNGFVAISACNLVFAGVIDTRNAQLEDGGGYNSLTYAGTFEKLAGSALSADDPEDSGANDLFCRCVDESPADGECDLPERCADPPVLQSSATPTIEIRPIPLAPCD